ncbi:hypothetical protein REPUB_Repub09cG0101800 [Reevesia pubescens]
MEIAQFRNWSKLESFHEFHHKDVPDLQWSTDGAFLVSGSVDNTCIIWDVNKGSAHQILDGHFHYVQGVAWDPLSKYVASLSSDRTCRIYLNKPQAKTKGVEKLNYICQQTIVKAEQQPVDDAKSVKNHLFHDETLPSFFNRLAWSPDGSFLLVPAGSYKLANSSETINTTYVISRKDLSRPSLQLPGASKPVVPVLFLRFSFQPSGIKPRSYDAPYLALPSQDGYCTLVEFEKDELGLPIPLSEPKIMNVENKSPIVQKPDDMVIETARADDSIKGDNTKMECAEGTEVKQASPSLANAPISN